MLMLKKTGRHCFPLPCLAEETPWKTGYSRVMIPFTPSEMLSARPGRPTTHLQIVKNSNMRKVS